MSNTLSEEQISDSFHSYIKSSLTQAKAEKLVDTELLSSAESDVMITGPALCFYFAALRSTTNPPSVPLPRTEKSAPPLELSFANCPAPFVPFLAVWAATVPRIQALTPDHQHDLARLICGLEPLAQPLNPSLHGIAADLRAVAIEISQRRTFQDRYAADLQAAIDAGEPEASRSASRAAESATRRRVKASFVPPPSYDESPGTSPVPSPRLPVTQPPSSPLPLASGSRLELPPERSRTPSPTLLPPDAPAIALIRETLYACLADVLGSTPTLIPLLKSDPPRAYFSAVALAVLMVARTAMTSDGSVVGVLGNELTIAQCPAELRPFMIELGAIRAGAQQMDDEDTGEAMRRAQRGEDMPESRMERVQTMLERGVGYDAARRVTAGEEGRRSLEGRAVAFTNRVNALALAMTRLKAFRERQNEVFKVLAAVTG